MHVNFALFLINFMKHIHSLCFAFIFNRLEIHFILSILLNLIIFESYSFSEMHICIFGMFICAILSDEYYYYDYLNNH